MRHRVTLIPTIRGRQKSLHCQHTCKKRRLGTRRQTRLDRNINLSPANPPQLASRCIRDQLVSTALLSKKARSCRNMHWMLTFMKTSSRAAIRSASLP